MDAPRSDPASARYDELHAEAAEALRFAANTLRGIRDRYRSAYIDELARWDALRDDLVAHERDGSGTPAAPSTNGSGPHTLDAPGRGAAGAAEAGAADLQLRVLRGDTEQGRIELGRHETELSRLELAIRNLESTWLFVERGDSSLVTDEQLPTIPTELRMRIVEAQEAERARLAQEVHDGPAQALSNAIFQVEFIDRVFESDPPMARTELRFLRELLRRELGDVRSFIGQLRPPVLVELGLDGSIVDTVGTQAALSGMHIATELDAPADSLAEAEQTVVLRVVQEALQNVRKHAGAANVVVATSRSDGQWVLEVRDDGRGFDTGAVAARGRRNFGLQFMRERAELVGAQFEVQSRPEAGTIVRLAIPVRREENG
ncbi:MAG TPA: histidine kinase [Candidatus Limnocylindrales bacterium]|nr:histidine kinase [Candidatus Limnocylindrales bacterium]